jgi:S-methylmethionine-dependent homocysteine/selenocysteine methylase
VAETRPALRITPGQPRLLDAPVGAELVRRGVRWRKHGLLTDTDAVRQVHVEMLEAGAELIRTNTLGLNGRIFLDVFKSRAHMAHIGAPGLDTLAPRLVARAVEIAREAREQAGRRDVPVAAVLSPLEHVFRPDLVPESDVAQSEHGELARAMAEAGADMFYVDALTTLRETRAALDAVQALGLPVIAAFVVDEHGDLLGGEALGDALALARLGRCEAVVLTGAPLEDLLRGLAAIGATQIPLGLAPICGYYDPPSWKFDFHPRFGGMPAPDVFAAEVVAALPADAAIVGAWCGAGPEHISALRDRLALPVAGGGSGPGGGVAR